MGAPARVISYTGAFHVERHLGLYYKVQKQLPQVKKLLIDIVVADTSKPIDPSEYADLGDIIIFAPEEETAMMKKSVAK